MHTSSMGGGTDGRWGRTLFPPLKPDPRGSVPWGPRTVRQEGPLPAVRVVAIFALVWGPGPPTVTPVTGVGRVYLQSTLRLVKVQMRGLVFHDVKGTAVSGDPRWWSHAHDSLVTDRVHLDRFSPDSTPISGTEMGPGTGKDGV